MIATLYKRWRHSRGYGVHSPFAFRIVRNVIQSPKGYGYYGYEVINRMAAGRLRRQLRMLLRLAAYCDVGSAYASKGKDNEPTRQALRLANREIKIIPEVGFINDARLIITRAEELGLEELCSLLERPGRIVLLRDVPRGWSSRLFDCMEEGVMFYDRHTVLAISRPGVQKVSYECAL